MKRTCARSRPAGDGRIPDETRSTEWKQIGLRTGWIHLSVLRLQSGKGHIHFNHVDGNPKTLGSLSDVKRYRRSGIERPESDSDWE